MSISIIGILKVFGALIGVNVLRALDKETSAKLKRRSGGALVLIAKVVGVVILIGLDKSLLRPRSHDRNPGYRPPPGPPLPGGRRWVASRSDDSR